MMAACTPFCLGAIQNYQPAQTETTVEDMKRCLYVLSWKNDVKANALYRDGSSSVNHVNSMLISWKKLDEEEEN